LHETEHEWLARLADHDPDLAEKVRRFLAGGDAEPLSHAEYVRAVGIAGPLAAQGLS
jgi:hypothetical protein